MTLTAIRDSYHSIKVELQTASEIFRLESYWTSYVLERYWMLPLTVGFGETAYTAYHPPDLVAKPISGLCRGFLGH
jgi:hypothetical protein